MYFMNITIFTDSFVQTEWVKLNSVYFCQGFAISECFGFHQLPIAYTGILDRVKTASSRETSGVI